MEDKKNYRHHEQYKIYSFGKIDYNKTGRAINEVEVRVALFLNEDNRPVFSVMCDVWNSKHTDCEICGQCLNAPGIAANITKDYRLFLEIRKLWRKWHLNDSKNGSPRQYEAMDKMTDAFKSEFYSKWPENKADYMPKWCGREYGCELAWLESQGVRVDRYNNEDMTWGKTLYYWPIDPEDLKRIKELVCWHEPTE